MSSFGPQLPDVRLLGGISYDKISYCDDDVCGLTRGDGGAGHFFCPCFVPLCLVFIPASVEIFHLSNYLSNFQNY